jgi:hypothetical protein
LKELESLQVQLENLPYDDSIADTWLPIWGSKYSSRNFYQQVFQQVQAHPVFKLI